MATEKIDIVVTEKGSVTAAARVRDVGTAATVAGAQVQSFGSILSGLLPLLAFAGISASVAKLGQYGEAYTRISNKILEATSSQREYLQVEQSLFDISQRTRTSLESNANLYERLAEATTGTDITTKELLRSIESLNLIMTASGETSETVSGALNRLMTSISTGTVDTRGLMTVLNQFPDLAQAIAAQLGVTAGRLKQMGEEGSLTSKALLEVFTSTQFATSAAAAFEKQQVTLSGAWTVLNNAVTRFVGQLDQTNGASATFAGIIITLANNLPALAGSLLVVGSALAAIKVQAWGLAAVAAFGGAANAGALLGTVIRSLLNPMTILTTLTTIASGGLNLLIPLIVAATTYILTFGQGIALTADGAVTLRGAFVGTFTYIIDLIGQAYTAITQFFAASQLGQGVAAVFTAIGDAVQWVIDKLMQLLQSLGVLAEGASLFDGLSKAIREASASGEGAAKSLAKVDQSANGANVAAGVLKETVKATTPEFRRMTEATQQSAQAMVTHQQVTTNALGEEVKVISEWARRSGAYFNDFGQAAIASAQQAAAAVDSISSSMSRGRSSASGSGRGGFSIASPGRLDTGNNHWSSDDVRGFARGGEFAVGGSGGTDSQLVQFMASPNERVRVETPAQQASSDRNGGRGDIKVNVSMTVNAKDADSFNLSRKTIVMGLQSELNRAVRSIG